MSVTTIPSGHALEVQQWAEGTEAEVINKLSFMGLTGKTSESVIQWRDTLANRPGQQETIGLRAQLAVAPRTSGESVEGNERAISYHSDSYVIDEIIESVRFDDVMTRQRVSFDMLYEAKASLSDALAQAIDYAYLNQLAGNTLETNGPLGGNNTITAPTTDRWLFAGGLANEAAVQADSTAIATLDTVSRCVQLAKTGTFPIRPARIKGFNQPLYVFLAHTYVIDQMKAADSRWDALAHSAMQGGLIDKNPLITGNNIIWDGCLILDSSRMPKGINGAAYYDNVYRSVFLGAQAGVFGVGRFRGTPSRLRWVEKFFQYDREYGVAASMIAGVKKLRFNSIDNAVITVSSYAAALTD